MIYFQSAYSAAFNQDKAREDARLRWDSSFKDINEHEDNGKHFLRLYFNDDAPVTQGDVDAFVAAYNPAALSTLQQVQQQRQTDATNLATRITAARSAIATAQTNLDAGLTAGTDGYSAGEMKQVLDLLQNNQKLMLDMLDKLLAVMKYSVS